ncbi:MAG: dihydrodipicolinate reductase, partial [bacterium]
MENQIKVVQFGLGSIGIAAAKLVLTKRKLRLVGGIDIDPAKVGVDLGDVLDLDHKLGTRVTNDVVKLLEATKPDVILHSTSSFLKQVEGQLEICIKSKASVISSCEQLFYPFQRDPKFCERIDNLAKEHGVTVLGTGVNPGLSMDVLVLAMSSVCAEVRKIEAIRVVDASKRRLPLQRKIGAGLKPNEFKKLVNEGKLGHIGLVESLTAVATSLDFEIDEIQESIEPKIAVRTVETPYLKVQPEEVAGIVHTAKGLKGGEERIKLELRMFVGSDEQYDSINIEADPPVQLKVEGGIFGDTATTARMVNAIPIVLKSNPGLITAMDLPMPLC